MKTSLSLRYKVFAGFWLAVGCLTSGSVPTASATVLTFQRDVVNPTDSGVWPVNYGDRVTTLSYMPPNYSPPIYFGPRPTWYYGAAGGFTPHIVADYRLTGNLSAEGSIQTSPSAGDLNQVFAGSLATSGNDYIKVILTADPGYLVQLSAFDIANKVADNPLHSLQIIADGSTILSQSSVLIQGGTTVGVDFTHFAGSWQGNQITLLLEATYNGNVNQHISSFGLDNISFSEVAVPEPTTMIAGALLLLPSGVSTAQALRKHRNSKFRAAA
jgi:hypothetical protein